MHTLKANKWFFGAFALFMLIGGVVLYIFEKGEVLLIINKEHNDYYSYFFRSTNLIGDGIFYPFVIIGLGFYKIRAALTALITLIITSIVAQSLKKIVFSDIVRPKLFFENFTDLNIVDGIFINSYNSFPSGHTIMAFSMFALVAFALPAKKWGWVFCLLAISAGFARVYMVQHFFVDIYFGAIISVLLTTIIYEFFQQRKLFFKQTWADKSISQLINKSG